MITKPKIIKGLSALGLGSLALPVLAQSSTSPTTFSIEYVSTAGGCPPFGDDGHLIFLFLVWLGIIHVTWPSRSVPQLDIATQKRWQRQRKLLLGSTIILIVLSVLSVARIYGWFGLSYLGTSFLAFITSAPAALALGCSELSDGYPTLRSILYLLTFTNLGLLLGARSRVLKRANAPTTIGKNDHWLLICINIIQFIMLVFMVLWATQPYIIADWFRANEGLL